MKTEEELWSAGGRCSAMELREATRGSMMVLPLKDPSSILVSRSDSQECKLVVKDFNVPSDRFSAPTSILLALHHRHHKGTTMHIILVLWDRAAFVVKLGTMLVGVQGRGQIKLWL
jgi:hypothetical protein